MKNRSIFCFLFVAVCIFAVISGCTEGGDKNNKEINGVSEEDSRQVAEDYVRDLKSYKAYNLTEPVLTEIRTLNCSSCWQFVYRYDLVSEKDPDVVDTATVTVTVIEGEIIDIVYSQGDRY